MVLTSLLKTTRLSNKSVPKTFRNEGNEVVGDSGGRANEMVVNLSKNNKSRNLMRMPNIGAIEKPNF